MGQEEKIIARVRKLLAIANDNAAGGEHERDTAMKMALKLLAMHNLAMADVGSGEKPPQEARVAEREVYYDYVWMRTMASAIAKLYFCHMFTTKTDKKDRSVFTFVGLESNVTTAREMFSYVVKSVVAEASRATTAARENQTFKWSFCKGAAHRIWERCTALRKEAEKEQDDAPKTGTALVLLSNVYEQENRANLVHIQQQLGVRLVQRKSTNQRNTRSDGFGQGREFGGRVGLNKQVK
jgi:hypothetical protein